MEKLLISPAEPSPDSAGERLPWHQVAPEKLNGIKPYMMFLVRDLVSIVTTDFALLVHWDGFAVNPHRWRADFLDYDYIGPPWPRFMAKGKARVGNGGFSLRSRRWLEAGSTIGYGGSPNEDEFMCNAETGCRIAPLALAAIWGIEHRIEEYPRRSIADCFGFHDFLHPAHRHLRLSPATREQKFDCWMRGSPQLTRLRWLLRTIIPGTSKRK